VLTQQGAQFVLKRDFAVTRNPGLEGGIPLGFVVMGTAWFADLSLDELGKTSKR
jgi:hypothetical protein